MKIEKTTGLVFSAGEIGVLVLYIILAITFAYRDILRKDFEYNNHFSGEAIT